jgi:hypothetical protein
MSENKVTEVIFAPGCFDDFEGTQEELDELVKEIQAMATSGELFERSTEVDLELYDLDEADFEDIVSSFDSIEGKRNLQ